MNCAECQDNLVACMEGLLDSEQTRQCQAHVESCAACQAEYNATARLQQRLVAQGQAAADAWIVEPVMRRVLRERTKPERTSIMTRLLQYRWGFGLGAAGAAAAILILTLNPYNAQAKAADVLAKGARAIAKISSVHLRGQLRTRPQDNFGYIDPSCEFYTIELWKQFQPDLKWRAEKPGRVAVMDGKSTTLYIRTANTAMRIPIPAPSAFDTDWLHKLANLSTAIENEISNAQAKGWKLKLDRQNGTDGRAKAIVTVEAKSNLPENDYLKNKFVDTSDTRRVYRFDDQTELLEAVQVYMTRPSGDVLIFELQQIQFNQPIEASVFQLDLPANVNWYQEPTKLPDNEKYSSMTAEQAARAFFEACGRSDFSEAGKFFPMPFNDQTRQYVAGLEVVSIGQSYTSEGYPGQYVPYEIKLKNGETKKHNLALKKDRRTDRWFVDGGF
jgi:outer membrane lipoprotein-sorting protein